MSKYATQHARASATVARKGAAVVFSKVSAGTYDAATDTYSTPTTTTIKGNAVRVPGDPKRYEALGLVVTEGVSLFFTPKVQGDMPEPGFSVTWNGTQYTVKDCDPTAPDGKAICATVVVVK